MMIYSGGSNQKLAEKIAVEMNTPLLLPEKFIFPDGEERIRITERVVDEVTILVQSLTPPVNQNIVEACFIVDGLKRSGAKSVMLVAPYLGYQRQDHIFRDGEAVSLEVVIKMLEGSGVDKILLCDLHSIKIPELFHIPVIHISALPVFAKKIKTLQVSNDNAVLISPDMGGIRRIKLLSEMLNDMPYASIEKDRDLTTGGVSAKEINLPKGVSLKGKDVFIVDDMISSGGTIVKAVELLQSKDVSKIFVFATHAIFSQNAPILLQEANIEKVFVANSVLVPKDKRFPKLEVLSIAEEIAKEIKSGS